MCGSDISKHNLEATKHNNEIIDSFWKSKIKYIAILNGGAIVSIITFLGQAVGKVANFHGDTRFLLLSIPVYALGLFSVVLEIAFRQGSFSKKLESKSNARNIFDAMIDISDFTSIALFPVGSFFAILGFYKFMLSL